MCLVQVNGGQFLQNEMQKSSFSFSACDDHLVPKGETVNKFEEVLTSSSPFLSSPTRFNPNRRPRGEAGERGPHRRLRRTAQPQNWPKPGLLDGRRCEFFMKWNLRAHENRIKRTGSLYWRWKKGIVLRELVRVLLTCAAMRITRVVWKSPNVRTKAHIRSTRTTFNIKQVLWLQLLL